MRPCQVCGANSWGPASQEDILEHATHGRLTHGRLLSAGPDLCFRCDNCWSIALKNVINEPKPLPIVEDPFTLGVTAMASSLKDLAPPSRPDRTERLVHTLLQSDFLDAAEVDTVQGLVKFVREIERELDARETQDCVVVSRQDLLALSAAIQPGSPWDPIAVQQMCQRLIEGCGHG